MRGVVEDVRRWVDDRRGELVNELARWVARPSVSATGEGMADAVDHGAALLRASGLATTVIATGGWPLLTGTAGDGAPHVLVYGHYDVQPPGPPDHWTSPPFDPQIRGGRLYGRGAADNKGQHLAHLLALRALRDLGVDLPGRVTVLLDGEEEIGSPNLAPLLRTWFTADHPDLVLWSAGPVHESGAPTVALGVRGLLTFELRAHGPTTPLHSGDWGDTTPNPAWRLIDLLTTMRAPDGTILVEGLPTAPETLNPPPDRPTITINSLTCEDADEHRTVVPSVAVARCDVRLAGDQRPADVTEALRAHVGKYAPDVDFVPKAAMPPSRTLRESAYMERVMRGVEMGSGREPLLIPTLGGSLPIGTFTEQLGVPCYGIPLANVDEANHAPNENLEVDRFLMGITTAASLHLSLRT